MTLQHIKNAIESSQSKYLCAAKTETIKEYSQYFTPKFVMDEMLRSININTLNSKDTIRVLEPSAGFGVLICGTIEFILKSTNIQSVIIDAFEIDPSISIELNKHLYDLKKYAKTKHVDIHFRIICQDFLKFETLNKYDLILSNPPFKKISKAEYNQYPLYKDIIYGQPNKYILFIAKSLSLLYDNGIYSLISPKNYLTGNYSQKLREFILKNYNLTHIHTFDSKKIFKSVDQEIIISCFTKTQKQTSVFISHNSKFAIKASLKNIIYDHNKSTIVVLKSLSDLELINSLSKLKYTLADLDLKVSVGPVVQFRNKEYLNLKAETSNSAPLLISSDIKRENKLLYADRSFPSTKKTHNKLIRCDCRFLIPNSRYILIQKIISANTNSIIVSAILEPNYFNSSKIGLDNNILYIHSINNKLDQNTCYGIYCFINSLEFNRLMTLINSTHAINVSDFDNIKLPDISTIKTLGKHLKRSNSFSSENCSYILNKYTGLFKSTSNLN